MGERGTDRARSWSRAAVDLVLPTECGGCGTPGVRWCADCAATLAGGALRVRVRADLAVPVWVLARYGGPPARAVTAYKDRGRADLAGPLGAALAAGVDELRAAGEIAEAADRPLVLVPAPASARARRRRGFDHVRHLVSALAAELAGGRPGTPDAGPVAIAPILALRGRVRDASGLGADERRRNLSGHVHRRPASTPFVAGTGAPASVAELRAGACTVLLVDDVVTTGTTLSECVSVLAAGGVDVTAALCVAGA